MAFSVKFGFTSSSKQQFDYIEGISYLKDGPNILEKKEFYVNCPELYKADQATFRIPFSHEMEKCAWVFRAYLKGKVVLQSAPFFIGTQTPCIALNSVKKLVAQFN